jgi:hypothetical protein
VPVPIMQSVGRGNPTFKKKGVVLAPRGRLNAWGGAEGVEPAAWSAGSAGAKKRGGSRPHSMSQAATKQQAQLGADRGSEEILTEENTNARGSRKRNAAVPSRFTDSAAIGGGTRRTILSSLPPTPSICLCICLCLCLRPRDPRLCQ